MKGPNNFKKAVHKRCKGGKEFRLTCTTNKTVQLFTGSIACEALIQRFRGTVVTNATCTTPHQILKQPVSDFSGNLYIKRVRKTIVKNYTFTIPNKKTETACFRVFCKPLNSTMSSNSIKNCYFYDPPENSETACFRLLWKPLN